MGLEGNEHGNVFVDGNGGGKRIKMVYCRKYIFCRPNLGLVFFFSFTHSDNLLISLFRPLMLLIQSDSYCFLIFAFILCFLFVFHSFSAFTVSFFLVWF